MNFHFALSELSLVLKLLLNQYNVMHQIEYFIYFLLYFVTLFDKQ